MHQSLSLRVVILSPQNWKMYPIPILFMKITKNIWNCSERMNTINILSLPPKALRVFTNVLTPPFKYLRSKGHLPVKVIDESLFLRDTFEICFKIIRATIAALRELGFTIHPEKSVLVPSQQTFLGFVLNSFKMTITLWLRKGNNPFTLFARISFQITKQ